MMIRLLLAAALCASAAACSMGDEGSAGPDVVEFLDPDAPDPDPPLPEGEEDDDEGVPPGTDAATKPEGDAAVEDDVPPEDDVELVEDVPSVEDVPLEEDAPAVEDASVAEDAAEGVDAAAPGPDATVGMDVPNGPPPPPPPFWVTFSRRGAGNAPDTAVEDAMVYLIRHAARGSRLRLATYGFTRYRPGAELVNAARRGVDVRVVVDGHVPSTPGNEVSRLRAGLGRDRVTVCSEPGTACIGTGIMHHKFITVSALDDGSQNVVAVASHNFTTTQLHLHNNVVVVRNDLGLFRAYERTFEDLRRDRVVRDYERFEDGERRTRAYFFPRADGDTVVNVLDSVRCDRTSRVRVAMAFFTNGRLDVARGLAGLQRDGCTVEVVVGNAGIPVGDTVLSTLRGAGVRVTLYPRRSGRWGLHSKYFLVDAPLAGGSAHRRFVFTGSHNWTGPANDINDENMLRVEDDGVYNAFLADWARVRAAARRR